MRTRDLLLTLEDAEGPTLALRIVDALQRAIVEGRLEAGSALPGSRLLAQCFKANRNTVILALREMEAQGWLFTEPKLGTFVARELPSGYRTRAAATPEDAPLGFDLPSLLNPSSLAATDAVHLADGVADSRLVPTDELAQGYQRALRRHGARLLSDRDPLGTPLLRESIAAWITERHGVRMDPARIMITRGSRGALALLAISLFRPGEAVAVEDPGNRGAWEILQQGPRLELHPVPVDAEGLVPDALAALLERRKIRMLYLTPRRQFPTGASLSRERGQAILRLAAQHRVPVVEDDYDGEFSYGQDRPQPLLALDRSGQVIHIASLSRLLAPGLRLGYVVLPSPLVPFLARARTSREEQGDPALEWTVADLIRDGELGRHVRRSRKVYEARRDHLVNRLRERLGDALEVTPPAGGMGLWLKVRPPLDAAAWVRAARAHGLALNLPAHFFLGPPEPAFRMGFTQADEGELDQAVERLVQALGHLRAQPGT